MTNDVNAIPPPHPTVLVVHGIGNQRAGATAEVIKQALASRTAQVRPEATHVKEVSWSGAVARPSGPRFLTWAFRVLPAVVVLGLRSRPAESLRPPTLEPISPWYSTFVLLFVPLLAGEDSLQLALLVAVLLALALSVQASWGVPTLARIAIVTVPIAVIAIAMPLAFPVAAAFLITASLLAARRNFLSDVWLACNDTSRTALTDRVVADISAVNGPLVILGHSMGAYLALGSLQHLDPNRRREVTLVTVGSAAAAISCIRAYERSPSARRRVLSAFALTLFTISVSATGMILLAAEPDWIRNGIATKVVILALVFGCGVVTAWLIDNSVDHLEATAESVDHLHAHPTRWVSIASTHDSVALWSSLGQGESTSLWTAGSSLPLLEHPLGKYLARGGLALEALRNEVDGPGQQAMDALERKSIHQLGHAYINDSARRSVLLVMFTSLYWIGPATRSLWAGEQAGGISALAAGLVGVIAVYVLLTTLQATFPGAGNRSHWGTALLFRPDLRKRGPLSEIAKHAIGLAMVGGLSAGMAFWSMVALLDDLPGTPPIQSDWSWLLVAVFIGGLVLTSLSPMPAMFILAGVWPPLLLLRVLSAIAFVLLLLLGAPLLTQVRADPLPVLVLATLMAIPAARVVRRASRLSCLARGQPLGPGFIQRVWRRRTMHPS